MFNGNGYLSGMYGELAEQVFPSKYKPLITAGERVAVTNLVDELTVGSQGGREFKADTVKSLKLVGVAL